MTKPRKFARLDRHSDLQGELTGAITDLDTEFERLFVEGAAEWRKAYIRASKALVLMDAVATDEMEHQGKVSELMEDI